MMAMRFGHDRLQSLCTIVVFSLFRSSLVNEYLPPILFSRDTYADKHITADRFLNRQWASPL